MTRFIDIEIGVSPPGARFNGLGLLNGGVWVRAALSVLASKTQRMPDSMGRVAFNLPRQQQELNAVLHALRSAKIEPLLDYHIPRNPTLSGVHGVPFYCAAVHTQSWGFLAGAMFAEQLACELPKPAPLIGHDAGCGVRKNQLRKLQIVDPRRVKMADVIEPHLEPFIFRWQMMVVSARFREVMLRSGMTGFEFLPIAGPNASTGDLQLSSGSCASDSQEHFQWVITGRSKPIPIREFSILRPSCGICGRTVGREEPYYLSQPLAPSIFEAGPDVQVCDELSLPDARRVMCLDGNLFASSRFVKLCVREKFRGFSSLQGSARNFSALYFGEPL